VDAPTKAELTYTHDGGAPLFHTSFNALAGVPGIATINASGAHTYTPVKEASVTVGGVTYNDVWLLAFDYFLVPTDLTAVAFDIELFNGVSSITAKTVSSAPVGPNKLTTVIVKLVEEFTADLDVIIEDEFDEEIKPLTDIMVDQTPLSLEIDKMTQLTAIPVPEDANGTLTWMSEDVNVATVTQDGTITAVAKGSTNIVVSCGNILKTIPVTAYRIENVALKKPVVASDVLSANVAANAVDGNLGSRWVANDVDYSEHWLEIDLQGEYTIERIKVVGDVATLNSDFKVQAWMDNTWTDMLSIVDSRTGTHEVSITPVTTTKVKYIGQDINYYPGETVHNGVRLWEIEVYARVSQ
jgi:hypothetical protein